MEAQQRLIDLPGTTSTATALDVEPRYVELADFAVVGAPKGKGRPRFARGTGHAYTPEETRNYEALLRLHAQQAMTGRAATDRAVRLTVSVGFVIPASWSKKKRAAAASGALRPTVKPDLDNVMKMADALNGVVWVDDAQVVEATVIKRYAEAPATRYLVEEIV